MKEITTVNCDDNKIDSGAVISAAVRCGSVRLIDNLLLGSAEAFIYNMK